MEMPPGGQVQCFGLTGLPEIPTVDFVHLFSADTLVCESSNHLSRGPVNTLPTTYGSSNKWGWSAGPGWHWSPTWDCPCCPVPLSAGSPSTRSTYSTFGEEKYAWCRYCHGCEVAVRSQKNKALSQLATGTLSSFEMTFGTSGPCHWRSWSAPLQTSCSLRGQVIESQK